MLVHPAEQSYQTGIDTLMRGKPREALAFFSGAIEIEKRISNDGPQARYLSYYGLCLGLTGGAIHEAVRCCRMSAKLEGYRPDVCWNLGRVLMMANQRREAYQALQWGLRMQPNHEGILRELKRMGRRRRPVLPFLSRTSVLNVFLGRLRTKDQPRAGARSAAA